MFSQWEGVASCIEEEAKAYRFSFVAQGTFKGIVLDFTPRNLLLEK